MLDGNSVDGAALTTHQVRSWSGSGGVTLELKGSWVGGIGARRMAMLAVYQERIYNDTATLKALFDLVSAARPGLLRPAVIERVGQAHATNVICGAMEALGPVELTQLMASLLPEDQLEGLVGRVIVEAREAVSKESWAYRDPESARRTERSLARAAASMTRHARLALLRLRAWPEIDRWAAQWRALTEERGRAVGGGGGRGGVDQWVARPPSEATARKGGPYDDEHLYFLARLETYRARAAGGSGAASGGALGGVGRSGAAAFGRAPGTPAGAGFRVGGEGAGAAGASGFGGPMMMQARALEAATAAAAATNMANDEMSPGVSLEVAKRHRRALVRALVEAAAPMRLIDGQLETQAGQCLQATRTTTSASEQVARRLVLRVEGQELGMLRAEAVKRGRAFLEPLSPVQGLHPLRDVQEWQYTREAPALWSRYADLPPTIDGLTLYLDAPVDSGASSSSRSTTNAATNSSTFAVAAVPLSPAQLADLLPALLSLIPTAVARATAESSAAGARSGGGGGGAAVGARVEAYPAGPWLPAAPGSPLQLRAAAASGKSAEVVAVGGIAGRPVASMYEARWVLPQATVADDDSTATTSPGSSTQREGAGANGSSSSISSSGSSDGSSGSTAASQPASQLGQLSRPANGAASASAAAAYSAPARLSQAQLTSLLAVLDTASEQLPGLLAPPPLTQLLGSAPHRRPPPQLAALSSAAAGAAVAAGGKGGDGGGAALAQQPQPQVAGMASAARARADASGAGFGGSAWRRQLGALVGGVARGAALLALAALPLLGARTIAVTGTPGGAPTTTTAVSRQQAAAPLVIQPANAHLGPEALDALCQGVEERLAGVVVLPVDGLGAAHAAEQARQARRGFPAPAPATGTAAYRGLTLNYQVVVSVGGSGSGGDGATGSGGGGGGKGGEGGQVVGCMPLDRPSASLYQYVPLAGELRGPAGARAVARHARDARAARAQQAETEAVWAAEQAGGKDRGKGGGKRKVVELPLFSAGGGASGRAAFARPPDGGGLAVLHLTLTPPQPPTSSAAGAAEAVGPGAQADSSGGRVVAAVSVRPWSDRDSVRAWVAGGADLPPGAAARAAGPRGGGGSDNGSGGGAGGEVGSGDSGQLQLPADVEGWRALLEAVQASEGGGGERGGGGARVGGGGGGGGGLVGAPNAPAAGAGAGGAGGSGSSAREGGDQGQAQRRSGQLSRFLDALSRAEQGGGQA
ncbi:hypothetical protein FOA52_007598 [Chlamydomonas sp. UWO 241]|nr:hypothetical protein FOA52_007598 [Chlamydomonas sp. UWO 241]